VLIFFYRGMLRLWVSLVASGAQREGGGPVDKFSGFMSELVSRNVGETAIQETRWLGSGENIGRILSLNRNSPVSFLVIAL